uniref:Uncharacterized protein n=1 Tax=Rhizophora mucronata TaxID=61149 RepID=A0A2P2QXC9_RHIMU
MKIDIIALKSKWRTLLVLKKREGDGLRPRGGSRSRSWDETRGDQALGSP